MFWLSIRLVWARIYIVKESPNYLWGYFFLKKNEYDHWGVNGQSSLLSHWEIECFYLDEKNEKHPLNIDCDEFHRIYQKLEMEYIYTEKDILLNAVCSKELIREFWQLVIQSNPQHEPDFPVNKKSYYDFHETPLLLGANLNGFGSIYFKLLNALNNKLQARNDDLTDEYKLLNELSKKIISAFKEQVSEFYRNDFNEKFDINIMKDVIEKILNYIQNIFEEDNFSHRRAVKIALVCCMVYADSFKYEYRTILDHLMNLSDDSMQPKWTIFGEGISNTGLKKAIMESDKSDMALQVALGYENLSMVNLLLKCGAQLPKNSESPLALLMHEKTRNVGKVIKIIKKMLAYGSNITEAEFDKWIYHVVHRSDTINHQLIDFVLYISHYFIIRNLIRQAQQLSPLTVAELIKNLFISYLDRSFYLTSDYKNDAKTIVDFISTSNNFDLIIERISVHVINDKSFKKIYSEEVREYLLWQKNHHSTMNTKSMNEFKEFLAPVLVQHSDPFKTL